MGTKERTFICIIFIASNMLFAIVQLVVLLIAAISQFLLWFGIGQIIWQVSNNAQLGLQLAPFISWAIVYAGFAVVWFKIWRLDFSYGSRWFYWKVLFAISPLIFALIMFNPKPDPMQMIPHSPLEIKLQFCTIVSGIVLFPLYSFGINKFILQKDGTVRIRNVVYVCVVMAAIGSMLCLTSWKLMSIVYNIY